MPKKNLNNSQKPFSKRLPNHPSDSIEQDIKKIAKQLRNKIPGVFKLPTDFSEKNK